MSDPLTGEHLALDLVNTRSAASDHLATPADLLAWWAIQADRLPGEVPAQVTAADLAEVHAVREHTARALDRARRGAEPPAADLAALNEAQRAAPVIIELGWDGSAVRATRRRDGTPGRRLAGWLAEAAADLLADPAVTRVRECAAGDCVAIFLGGHPRRRWCSAARCGNRVRVARHYQRHKAG